MSVELETRLVIAPDCYRQWSRYLVAHGRNPDLELDRERDVRAISQAHLDVVTDWGQPSEVRTPVAKDRTTLAIGLMSRYMRYLPALYRQANNDVLGRFLLANEGVLSRMEQRLEHLEAYFDPMLAPPHLLPWLAAWGGEQLDARWSEPQQRALLKELLLLQRTRGTPKALKDHIALYIGQQPKIEEQRSGNLALGSAARLGQSLALGRANQAHAFSVLVPPAHYQDPPTRAVVESVIAWHQPAHTRSQLQPDSA